MRSYRTLWIAGIWMLALALLSGWRAAGGEGEAAPEDPDARFANYHAKLELDQEEFSDAEPIALKLKITEKRDSRHQAKAQWWLYTPEKLRIEDENGRELNLFALPVCGPDHNVRSKIVYGVSSTTIDLTSFIEPQFGTEYVHRFAPGKYTVTYFFTHRYPHVTNSFNYYDMAYPKIWGEKQSNTVTFRVRAAAQQPDIAALFKKAEAAVDADRANEARSIYAQIVLSAGNQSEIESAIREIMLIRKGHAWDDERLQRQPAAQAPGWLKAELAAKRPEFGKTALAFSLLHVSALERKAWLKRFVRNRYPPWGPYDTEDEKAAEAEIFGDVDFTDLFNFPQFRELILDEIKDPEHCARPYAEIFLGMPLVKELPTMTVLLRRFPYEVLEYYTEYDAPKELVPLIVGCFDDRTKTWGNGKLQALVMDSALVAFGRATKIKVPLGKDAEQLGRREQTKEELLRWWKEHKNDFEGR